MKKLFILSSLFLFLLLNSCTSKTKSTQSTSVNSNTKVEKRVDLYAFHGTRQCTTCKNMKAFTKSTLDKYFAKEIKSGILTYQIIDVDEEKNYELAEKFEATGTALMVNNIQKGKEDIEDWSDFAFEFANGDQAVFEGKLKQMLSEKLK
jgi:thioredoxin-related protein